MLRGLSIDIDISRHCRLDPGILITFEIASDWNRQSAGDEW
jgi:hypothetical protein